ncbi:hypothetical protein NX009_12765 [Klebsiella pneumoniae]|nr:hypothetical protein [Klebsiella pneumoniae]
MSRSRLAARSIRPSPPSSLISAAGCRGWRRRNGRQPCPHGAGNISEGHYRGGRGLDPEVIAEITHRYGFDKPLHERYLKMLGDYLRFDFGDSLFRSASVLQLIKDSLLRSR